MALFSKKSWLGRLVLIAFGLFCLLLAEGALRLVWTPQEESTWTAIRPFAVENGTARIRAEYAGTLHPQQVELAKPEGLYRIVCLGGSMTFGYPYEASVAWPGQLQRWLQELYPQRRFEVINLGGNSYGSERVLGLLNGLEPLHPDLVVVALGDTEFVEDSYRAALDSALPVAGLGRLRSLYLARLLERLLPRNSSRRVVDVRSDATDDNALFFSPVVDGTVYRPDPVRRAQVKGRFGLNLGRIIERIRELHAQPLLLTLPANLLGWPPADDSRRPDDPAIAATWQEASTAGERAYAAGDLAGAVTAWLRGAGVWSENATFCYRLGRGLFELGRVDEARPWLEQARDLDPAPVRGAGELVSMIRDAAADSRLPLVDLAAEFARLSPGGISGDALLLDYAHPNRRGHRLTASLVWQTLRDLLPDGGAYDSTALASLRQELEQGDEQPPQLDPNLAFVWAQVYERKGLSEKARTMYRFAHDGGYRPYATVPLAQLEAVAGNLSVARSLIEEAIEETPEFVESYPVAGWVCWLQGDLESAEHYYRTALERGNRDALTYGALAEILMDLGRGSEALTVVMNGFAVDAASCRLADLQARIESVVSGEAAARRRLVDFLGHHPVCSDSLSADAWGLLLGRAK